MWKPTLLDMTRDECRGNLRRLELESYSTVVTAFRAQGVLCDTKIKILEDLRTVFHISQDRHRAESRRVANDERLCTIANTLCGINTCPEWAREGRRLFPLLPRNVPLTALSKIANDVARKIVKQGHQFPSNTNHLLEGMRKSTNQIIVPHINLFENAESEKTDVEEPKEIETIEIVHEEPVEEPPPPPPPEPVQPEIPISAPTSSQIQTIYQGTTTKGQGKKKKPAAKKTPAVKKTETTAKPKANKRATKFSNVNSSYPSDIIDFDCNEFPKIAADTESEALQIATSKKDITINISKLNLQAQKHNELIKKHAQMNVLAQPIPRFMYPNEFGEGSSKMHDSHLEYKPTKEDLINFEQIDLTGMPKVCTIRKLNYEPDLKMRGYNKIVTATVTSTVTSTATSTAMSQPNLFFNMKDITCKPIPAPIQTIGPVVMRNIQIPNTVQIKNINKNQVKLVTSSNGKVFIQPATDFTNQIKSINPITSVVAPINNNPVNNSTNIRAGISFKKITPVSNINPQQLKISKPKMIVMQRTVKDQIESQQILTKRKPDLVNVTPIPIKIDNTNKKNQVFVIGSVIKSDMHKPTTICPTTSNINIKSNIITEDTPVDILPVSEFYVDAETFQKAEASGHLSSASNNFTTPEDIQNHFEGMELYDDDAIVVNTDEPEVVIGTTDWELELDQEANKTRDFGTHYMQRNVYHEEDGAGLVTETISSSQETLNSIIEEFVDDGSRHCISPFQEIDHYEECIDTTEDLDTKNIDVEYLEVQNINGVPYT